MTTNNTALSASDALSRLKTGDTVTTTGSSAAIYTYDASKGNFTTQATVADGDVVNFANTLKPAAGTTA
ncbi:flagellin FliC, partial [Escherichia coli]|nr:flagellin FliC [Escherichia coli]